MDGANAASAASPRMRSSLAQRLLSAAILIPAVIGLVWWSYWSVVAAVVVVTIVALLELYTALAHGSFQPRLAVGLAVALVLNAAAIARPLVPSATLLPLVLTLIVIGTLIAELPRHDHQGALANWALTLAGALYISWLLSHFVLLRALDTPLRPHPLGLLRIEPGAAWLYMVLIVTWVQDTAAYFAGRAWGRHKLAPVLSPKKTWEGWGAGLVASIAAGVVCVPLFGLPIALISGALLGLIAGLIGPLGDLSESLIKRQIGLKDASHLIPGHGGLLDRADSILFTGPVLYYLIVLLTG